MPTIWIDEMGNDSCPDGVTHLGSRVGRGVSVCLRCDARLMLRRSNTVKPDVVKSNPYVCLADERIGVHPSGRGISLAELPDVLRTLTDSYPNDVRKKIHVIATTLNNLLEFYGDLEPEARDQDEVNNDNC